MSGAAAADDHSSLAEDSEYDDSEMKEDSGLVETNEVSEVNEAPVDVNAPPGLADGGGAAASSGDGGGAAASSGEGGAAAASSGEGGAAAATRAVYTGGRLVLMPYLEREDVGTYGIYVGNWSGRRKLQIVNDHLGADLIARNAAQVLIAQEVDPMFIAALRDPERSREAKSAPHPVAGEDTPTVVGDGQGRNYNERFVNLTPWHVAVGTEGTSSEASTLIVAARSSVAKSSTVVEWRKLFHCMYQKKGKKHLAYSRILCAQVEWRSPVHGYRATQFLNLHFHNLVAKKELRP